MRTRTTETMDAAESTGEYERDGRGDGGER